MAMRTRLSVSDECCCVGSACHTYRHIVGMMPMQLWVAKQSVARHSRNRKMVAKSGIPRQDGNKPIWSEFND